MQLPLGLMHLWETTLIFDVPSVANVTAWAGTLDTCIGMMVVESGTCTEYNTLPSSKSKLLLVHKGPAYPEKRAGVGR